MKLSQVHPNTKPYHLLVLSRWQYEENISEKHYEIHTEEDYIAFLECKAKYFQQVKDILNMIPKREWAIFVSKIPNYLSRDIAEALRT